MKVVADAGELTAWLERAASEGSGLLLEERVSIRNLPLIFEAIAEAVLGFLERRVDPPDEVVA